MKKNLLPVLRRFLCLGLLGKAGASNSVAPASHSLYLGLFSFTLFPWREHKAPHPSTLENNLLAYPPPKRVELPDLPISELTISNKIALGCLLGSCDIIIVTRDLSKVPLCSPSTAAHSHHFSLCWSRIPEIALSKFLLWH